MPETAVKPGIEIQLADGTKVTGADESEALKNALKMIEDNKTYARQMKERAETYESQNAALAAQIEANKPKPVVEPGKFSNDQYYTLLNSDPIAAQNYLDSFRFGIPDPAQVPQTFINMNQQVTSLTQQTVTAQFLQQHDDFPQDAGAVKTFSARMQQLFSSGYPFTADTMGFAYRQLVDEGAIKPMEKRTSPADEPPNPSLGGSGAGGGGDQWNDPASWEKLDDKTLEAKLKAAGALR